MMDIKLNIKTRIDRQWHDLSAAPYAGFTLRELFEALQDTDTLCKFEAETGTGYFCGTSELSQMFLKRGDRAYSFATASKMIARGQNAEILDEIVVPKPLGKEFEGATLEEYIFHPDRAGK